MAFILLRAFSFGAGTYTGIEAVSNGLQMLREPRVRTGRRTMFMMATSLAFTAGGLLVCYLLTGISLQPGKTLNASLIEKLVGQWHIGGLPAGAWLLAIMLVSEGAILFVAAQTGFLDGPRVLGNMAIDSWVPNRFMHISERLVVQNGVLFMGLGSLLILFFTKGKVQFLLVMYSINVFLTFTLSQLGMCRHWLQEKGPRWGRKFFINALGLLISVAILCVTVTIKFREGGWITLAVTSSLICLCLVVKRHYSRVFKMMKRLDEIMSQVGAMARREKRPVRDPASPTAVMFVRNFGGLGVHSFLNIHRMFPGYFKNFVFISIGVVDWKNFKGAQEVKNLEEYLRNELKKYVELAHKFGFYAETLASIDIDTLDALEKVCQQVQHKHAKATFFVGKLIFEREGLFTRVLHNQTAYGIQRRLQFSGIPTIILPIRVMKEA
jgi:amino acid transporter